MEYPQLRSGLLQDLFPFSYPASSGSGLRSVTETNPSVWAAKTVLTFLSSVLITHVIEKPIYSLVSKWMKRSSEEKEVEIKLV